MMTMTTFDRLCGLLTEDHPIEHVDNPYQDAAQEAWLKGLTWLGLNDVELKSIRTVDDLREAIKGNEGFIVRCFHTTNIDMRRKNKQTAPLYAVDSVSATHEPIDLYDIFEHLTNREKDAVLHFLMAQRERDKGRPLSNQIRQQLKRDRKATGFALKLQ